MSLKFVLLSITYSGLFLISSKIIPKYLPIMPKQIRFIADRNMLINMDDVHPAIVSPLNFKYKI